MHKEDKKPISSITKSCVNLVAKQHWIIGIVIIVLITGDLLILNHVAHVVGIILIGKQQLIIPNIKVLGDDKNGWPENPY